MLDGGEGAQATEVRGFAELTLETRDLTVLERFYTRCFGLRPLSRDPDRVWLAAGRNARLGLWLPGAKEFGDQGGRHVHFALRVAPGGLQRLIDRLREGGVAVRGPVEHPGGDRSAYLEDPEGNVVELWDFFERGEGAEHGNDALARDPGAEGSEGRRSEADAGDGGDPAHTGR